MDKQRAQRQQDGLDDYHEVVYGWGQKDVADKDYGAKQRDYE
jgi:hypothetical protein